MSFIAMRDWTKNIPSTTEKRATSTPTERLRKSSRARRKRQAAIRTPKSTPMIRQAKANWPMSTVATLPSAERATSCSRSVLGISGVTSAPRATGRKGSWASEKTASPLVSIV